MELADESRTILHGVWEVESNASAYLGFRRSAAGQRTVSRGRRPAERGSKAFVADANAVLLRIVFDHGEQSGGNSFQF